MAPIARRAEIIGKDQFGTKVALDEFGETYLFPIGSMGYPSAVTGTKGQVEYRSGPSYGLWFFAADETISESQS